jgi:cyclophilin family peptidyl-prolyl cis-trans isomerase
MRPFAAALAVTTALASVSVSAVEELEPIHVLSAAAYKLPPGTAIAVVELVNGSVVEIALLEDAAPLATAHFASLAERRFYDETVWNRVVADFVVQGGAPAAVGRSDEAPAPEPESNDEVCTRGAVFLARSVIPERDEGYRYAETVGDQFCILLDDAFYLNDDFTVFGRVVSGMGLLDDVEEMEPIVSVRVVRVP